MRFRDLLGQDAALEQIRTAVSRGRTPHAFLFHGRQGTGKTTAALALARLLQCAAPTAAGEPCEACPSCHKSLHFNHPDIQLLPPTPSAPDTQAGESQRLQFISDTQADFAKQPIFRLDESRPLEHRIATMRKLKQEASRAAVDGPWKVFLLKRAGALNTEAANAILKLLEEPNPGTVLILGVERLNELPDTIRSRCALVRFRDLAVGDIERLLAERLAALKTPPDPADMRLAARVARGSLTRAAALLEEDVRALRDEAVALLDPEAAGPGRHEAIEPWARAKDRERLDLFLELMLLWYGDVHRLRAGHPDATDGLANADRAADLDRFAARLSAEQLRAGVQAVEDARRAVDGYGYVPLVLSALVEGVPRGVGAVHKS
jgi:DNA polymerase-3 subunit delta'